MSLPSSPEKDTLAVVESDIEEQVAEAMIADELLGPIPDPDLDSNLENVFDDDDEPTSDLLKDTIATPPRHRATLVEEDWRNDKRDLPHRKATLFQIAKMLRDRKQNPTQKWLKELPHKARKLEEKLYKQAPTREAYLDESTFKRRVKKVARIMTNNYRRRKSVSSSSRRSPERKSAMSSPSPERYRKPTLKSSPASSDEDTSPLAILRRPQPPMASPAHGTNLFPSSSTNNVASITPDATAMRGGSSFRGGGLTVDTSSMDGSLLMTKNSLGVNRSNASLNGAFQNSSNSFSTTGMTPLEEQQRANQKLQQQILENIRQQQQLMRELVNTSKGIIKPSTAAMNANRSSSMPVMLNIANPPNNKVNMAGLAHSMLNSMTSSGGNSLSSYPHQQHQQQQRNQSLLMNNVGANMGGENMGNMGSMGAMNMLSQQQRMSASSSGYHPTMPPPNRHSNGNASLEDTFNLSANSFKW